MHFDVLFLDLLGPKYYSPSILEREPLGGTEAAIVRVAEGLGSLGFTVGIIQDCEPFETLKEKNVFLIHVDHVLEETTCDHFVQIRNVPNSTLFPKAKKYVWLHDLGFEHQSSWLPELRQYDIKVIAVSRWHMSNLQNFFSGFKNMTYIYNPVPEDIYINPGTTNDYDKNIICWLSSPSKGLSRGIEIFKRVVKQRSSIKLIIFNPGYFPVNQDDLLQTNSVVYQGPQSCRNVWRVVKKALCVFYPCQVEETFGCIASESNALGTPLATYRKGGLIESVSSDLQFLNDGDEVGLINKVIDWHDNGRSTVSGKEEFKLSRVINEWIKILGLKK